MVQKIGGTTLADQLTGRHWQQLARECGLNPGEVLDRVAALAKSVIAEAEMAETEVGAMPAGGHAILYQTRQAIERRALALLASLLSGDVGRADLGHASAAAEATRA
jgi:serine/threonine-protein kinase HipA